MDRTVNFRKRLSAVEATCFAALSQGKLMIQRCADCKRAIFIPGSSARIATTRPSRGAGVSAGTVHSR